jgi:hypothetical protein
MTANVTASITIIRFAMNPSYVVRDRSFNYLPGSRGAEPAPVLLVCRFTASGIDKDGGCEGGLRQAGLAVSARYELAGQPGHEERVRRVHLDAPRNRFHGPNPPSHGRGRSGSAPPFTELLLTVLRQFEAVAQEGQQLVRGPEAELAPRIDFLDPPGDTTFRRVGVGVELENES